MSTVAQNYYGTRCVSSVTGDYPDYAREVIARNHGFDMVPPADIDVTEETDTATFTRFLYDEWGVAFSDIIDNMILTDSDDSIRYLYKETDTEVDVTDEQKEYLLAHYSEELKAKIEELKAEAKNPKDKAKDVATASGKNHEEITTAEEVADEETVVVANKPSNNEAHNDTGKIDPARMHIPNDGFMQTATPEKPVNVTVEKPAEMVSPLSVTGIFKPVQPDQFFMPNVSNDIYASFPYLKDLETKITAGGKFKVGYEWASGLLKVNVSSTDKPNEVLENYSLTLDLNGYVVTTGAKWWPGVENKVPVDFRKAYRYDLAAIDKYLAGEEIPNEFVCFDENVAALNKSIDLRTVFTIAGMTDDDAKYIFAKMKDATKKLSTRINKEYPKARFRLSNYVDKDNFELQAAPDVYTNIGGALANTAGAAAKIQVAGSKQPKLFK